MAAFLTPEWAEELTALVRDSDDFRSTAGDAVLRIRHVVTGGPRGDLEWDLRLDPEAPAVEVGRLAGLRDEPDVTVTTTWGIAVSLASGKSTMRHEEALGHLSVSGDLAAFFRHNAAVTCFDQLQAGLDTDYS